ncbi:MAG: diguanylate cyclase, partial [Syntrophomonadaceae bacterium]|nr:diguanylate cyclase [Syntrophomonadaceae bacterium]
HYLYHRSISFTINNGLSIAHIKMGPFCWFHMAYVNLAEIAGSILLLIRWLHLKGYGRQQAGAMFIGSVLPWFCVIMYITGHTPLNLDLGPFGLIVTSLIYIWGIFRYGLFELVPIARSTVFEKMMDAVLVLDIENRIVDLNMAAVNMFGKKLSQDGKHLGEYFEKWPVLIDKITNMDSENTELQLDINDDVKWVHLRISHLKNEQGKISGRLVIIRDISKRKKDEARLEEINNELLTRFKELNQYNLQIRKLNEMISLLQACGRLEHSYDILVQNLPKVFPGIDGGLYIKREESNLLDLVASWDTSYSLKPLIAIEECYSLQQQSNYLLKPGTKKPGCKHLEYNENIAYLCIPIMTQGEIIGLLHFYTPDTKIDEKRFTADRVASDSIVLALVNIKMREMLIQQSIRDPLTRLFNRRYMQETLQRELLRAERKSAPVAIIMADIDHFKRINDNYGHSIGDKVLQEVSSIMESCIRSDDIACRYGGEEFTLIMPGASLEVALQRAEDLRMRIKSSGFMVSDHIREVITISLGVAVYPEHGTHPDTLLKSADQALYQAKQGGRDRVMQAE